MGTHSQQFTGSRFLLWKINSKIMGDLENYHYHLEFNYLRIFLHLASEYLNLNNKLKPARILSYFTIPLISFKSKLFLSAQGKHKN